MCVDSGRADDERLHVTIKIHDRLRSAAGRRLRLQSSQVDVDTFLKRCLTKRCCCQNGVGMEKVRRSEGHGPSGSERLGPRGLNDAKAQFIVTANEIPRQIGIRLSS